MATLLKQVPAAAKFKSKLEALEQELVMLRAENAHLQDELAQYLEQWETLDGPQLNALQFLAESNGHAAQIAKRFNFNIQIAETGLVFLAHHRYVAPVAGATAARGKKALFALAPKGERYLRERGFIK